MTFPYGQAGLEATGSRAHAVCTTYAPQRLEEMSRCRPRPCGFHFASLNFTREKTGIGSLRMKRQYDPSTLLDSLPRS